MAAVAGSAELAVEDASLSVGEAAKVAGPSGSVAAGVVLLLVAPDGVSLGGRIVRASSRSRCDISCSICDRNSFEARLNSFR